MYHCYVIIHNVAAFLCGVCISGGKPSLSNITTVRITMDDINDLKPWFLYTPYTAVIKENENRSLLKVCVECPSISLSLVNN